MKGLPNEMGNISCRGRKGGNLPRRVREGKHA